MEKIDDLSYSNIVKIIDGNLNKASTLLEKIAYSMEDNNRLIIRLEQELKEARDKKGILLTGVINVLKHIHKETPLMVQRDGHLVVITDNNISIERNVI